MRLNILQRQKLTGAALAALPLSFLLIFFIAPVVLLLIYSFWTPDSFSVISKFTLQNYIEVCTSTAFLNATLIGLQNGFWTAVVSVAIAYPVAYYIVYRSKTSIIFYLVLLSWFSSYLVRVYAWRTILGTNGLINSTLMGMGVINEPLSFILFSPFAATVTLVHIMFPFALLLLVASLRDIKREYLDAALDLGANSYEVFKLVILPMSNKGLVGAFMFTFVLSAGDYITPQLLGGSDGVTSGLLIANQFRSAGNWPLGSAMAFMLLVLFGITYAAFVLLLRVFRVAPGIRYHD